MRFAAMILGAAVLAGCQSAPPPKPETKFLLTPDEQAAVAKREPLDAMLIESPAGNVTFTHKKHYERVSGDCTTCHPKVFPQALEPLNYKRATHRAAEGTMTSCAACHAVGGAAFAADSNCTKCHAERQH